MIWWRPPAGIQWAKAVFIIFYTELNRLMKGSIVPLQCTCALLRARKHWTRAYKVKELTVDDQGRS